MAYIDPGVRARLDNHPPKSPILGSTYKVEVWSRGAVRYTEQDRRITMFSDLVKRTDEPYYCGIIYRLLNQWIGNWCLGVYIEAPLRWDDDDKTEIPLEHEQEILLRVEDALKKRCACYRIERGPSQQHHSPTGLARDRPAKLQF